jgi:uncharacterized DUF497 family protein
MVITWDEPKRAANRSKHGLDFEALSLEFFERAVTIPTKRGRLLAVGRLDSSLITVVFALLGREAVSVISMRPASKKERLHAAQA